MEKLDFRLTIFFALAFGLYYLPGWAIATVIGIALVFILNFILTKEENRRINNHGYNEYLKKSNRLN